MLDDPRCANDLQGAGPYHNNGNLPLQSWLESWGTSLNMTFSLNDSIELKSITAYRENDWKGVRDADNTPLTILNTNYDVSGDQFSQELQLTMKTDVLLGVFGLYYFTQKSDDIVTVDLNPPPPGIQHDSDNNKVDNKSWAASRSGPTSSTIAFQRRWAAATPRSQGRLPDQYDLATPNVKQVPRPVVQRHVQFVHTVRVGPAEMDSGDHELPELLRGLQGRWLEQPLQPGAHARTAGGTASVRAEEAQTIELGTKMDLAGNTVRLNLRDLHLRLQGHAAHVSRAGAERRRAVHHQCRQDQHRRRGSRAHLGAHCRSAHRGQRGLSRREHR
jgi:hypothetical protein